MHEDNNILKEDKKNMFKQYWFVVRQLASREIKHGNASKTLGQLWNILTPIISMITLTILFATVFKRNDVREYIGFVFTGTILFSFYDHGMSGSLKALSGNKTLMIRTKIPRNLLVLEKVYVALVQMSFSLIGYAIVLIVTGVPVGPALALAPIDILLSAVIILGIGKILAVINVYFADISYFYKVLMRLVFYGSGLFYDVLNLSPAMQRIISFNPIHLSISFARSCILYNTVPGVGIWVKLIVYAIGLYIIGNLIFKKGSQDVVAKL